MFKGVTCGITNKNLYLFCLKNKPWELFFSEGFYQNLTVLCHGLENCFETGFVYIGLIKEKLILELLTPHFVQVIASISGRKSDVKIDDKL